jgi:hypothetical protein
VLSLKKRFLNNDPRFPVSLLEKLGKIDMSGGYESVAEQRRAMSASKIVTDFVMTNLKEK